MHERILVVDDDAAFRRLVVDILSGEGYGIIEAGTAEEALKLLADDEVDLVLSDQRMPGMDGLELTRRIRSGANPSAVILMTAFGTIPNAVEAVRLGATDYLTKPLESPTHLRVLVRKVLGHRKSVSENEDMGFLGRNPKVLELLSLADRAAATDTSILITGESGTGKEILARRIHEKSRRAGGPFIAVNCASIPEQLAESELFGHERGAFTGATSRRTGRFEQACGGTLFLDEIGELPEALQAKLLRALEERRIERVGGSHPIEIDFRLISATNRGLDKEVERSRFRADLLYRIDVFRLEIPPLRERPEDIEILSDALLKALGRRIGVVPGRIDPGAMAVLRNHSWPGNVRELRNVLERALILSAGGAIKVSDLGHLGERKGKDETSSDPIPLVEQERRAILQALETTGGHREQAAKLLGISVRTLYNRLREYDIRD